MKHESTYRVPYADTDQMKVVYYANYFIYFERSRTDMLRDLGLSYREMEERGFILPVAEAHCKYRSPAHYDDLLTFRSWVAEMRGVRVTIRTDVLRGDTLLVSGSVTLACVNAEHKLVRLPDFFTDACRKVFEPEEGGAK